MQTDQAESLRLVAKDEVDLEVVSTLLQDAIIVVPICNMMRNMNVL